jgi:tetratricopeptide (TPR) repeat protein
VLYKLALSRYRASQPWPAVTALQKAIAIDPRFAEAYYLLGLCLRDMQRPDAALAALERSVALAPAMLQAREELAELYGRLGRRDDRLAQLEALLALDPGPSREVTLGVAYAARGRTERAVVTLGHAAERYPDHAYTYVALGRVWLESAQARPDRVHLSKALEALENAAGADDTSEALTLLGRALLMASDEELAERVLQQAADKLPADPLAFYYLAEVSERRGHADTARRALLDYQALQGEDTDRRRRAALAERIADLSMQLHDSAFAVEWYQRALRAGASDIGLLVRLAEAQADTGDVPAARVTLAKALDADPANDSALALQRKLR